MTYNWNWGVLFQEPYLGWLISGFGWTFAISIVAWIIAVTVGTFFGVLRTLGGIGGAVAGAYVALFRNTPLLVQLFLWYFVVPEVLPESAGTWLKRELPNPEFWTACIAVGMFSGARITEQVRATVNSVRTGIKQAAASFGLTLVERYRYIILPIAVRFILPSLTSETLNTVKNSSLALTIGLLELTGASHQIESYTFRGFEAFTAATVIYMTLSFLIIAIMHWAEKRIAIPGLMGGGK